MCVCAGSEKKVAGSLRRRRRRRRRKEEKGTGEIRHKSMHRGAYVRQRRRQKEKKGIQADPGWVLFSNPRALAARCPADGGGAG